ncbi:hypothetical protein C7M84_023286 [Penaeus vannamei]|uniref:Uncharacterized protein n=1 Tax=Penaeus vannamei TaxID=6689 RepID=A0A423U4A3_PENVA|nr:hypothetical protein C7M84_023286 [Penaeus vannamei]
MVSSSEDPDSGPGTGDEAGENGRGKVDGSGQPSQPQQRSRVDRSQGEKVSTERKIKTTETRRETITTKGMHDLSSAINSLDDHFQAGLQEVRNSLASIHQERNTLTEHLRSVSEMLVEVSGEKNECQNVISDLQQEVSSIRDQLTNEQRTNAVLRKKIHEMENENESHMQSIASQLRDRQLAHRSIVKWRRKVLERGHYSVVRLLEEENSQLRAELLKCQEAAKQAFLRSANALNSEAITMFQKPTRGIVIMDYTRPVSFVDLDADPALSEEEMRAEDWPLLLPQAGGTDTRPIAAPGPTPLVSSQLTPPRTLIVSPCRPLPNQPDARVLRLLISPAWSEHVAWVHQTFDHPPQSCLCSLTYTYTCIIASSCTTLPSCFQPRSHTCPLQKAVDSLNSQCASLAARLNTIEARFDAIESRFDILAASLADLSTKLATNDTTLVSH